MNNKETDSIQTLYEMPLEGKIKELLISFPLRANRVGLLIDLIKGELNQNIEITTSMNNGFDGNPCNFLWVEVDGLGSFTLSIDEVKLEEFNFMDKKITQIKADYITYNCDVCGKVRNFRYENKDRDQLKKVAFNIIKYMVSIGTDRGSIPLLLKEFPDFSKHILSLPESNK